MKYAAFTTLFSEYSIHQTIKKVKELGFDGIEIGCREPHLSPDTSIIRVQEIKQLADDAGLEIPALAGYMGGFSVKSDTECEEQFEQFKKLLERAEILGSSMIRVGPGGPNAFLAQNYHYEKAAYWLNRCAEAAKAVNINVVLEIHNVTLIETVENCKRLIQKINFDNVGFIHDAGNMYISDTDFGRKSILDLGNQLFHVHIKDEKRVEKVGDAGTFYNATKHGKEAFMHCRLGEGAADHQPLFDALKETGYDQWITLETAAPFPLEERMQQELKKVKQMLG